MNQSGVYKISLQGGSYGAPASIGSSFSSPSALAAYAAGDLFVGDEGNDDVIEITPAGLQTTVPVTGLLAPSALAVDAAGDLFIADTGNDDVVEVNPGGQLQRLGSPRQSRCRRLQQSPFCRPLWRFRPLSGLIDLLPRSQAPSLSFAATEVGSVSSDSPRSVIAQNIGNAALTVRLEGTATAPVP